jgi:hypothetical protein
MFEGILSTEEKKNKCTKFWQENVNERDHFERSSRKWENNFYMEREQIRLKHMTGFVYLSIGTSGGIL